MSYETILFTVDRGVARLTLNRPEKLNSFNTQMHEEVRHALENLNRSDARVLVHAAIGAIQSALFHASGLPDDRLRALLTTAAESILGCATAS